MNSILDFALCRNGVYVSIPGADMMPFFLGGVAFCALNPEVWPCARFSAVKSLAQACRQSTPMDVVYLHAQETALPKSY